MSQDKYESDGKGGVKYPRDARNWEVVKENQYAWDKNKTKFYPRDDQNNEYMDESLGLIERNGEYVYPIKSDGTPNYRTEKVGSTKTKQLYERINDKWILGRGFNGDEFYAKDENLNEYYPEDYTPAKKADGSMFYAQDSSNNTIFPKKPNQHEYYLTMIDIHKRHTIPNRYAREDADEIYPKRLTTYGLVSEHILKNRYAERGSTKYYPRDGYNNEYYLSTRSSGGVPVAQLPSSVLSTYAVTNDGKVILPGPSPGGAHYIDPSVQPSVTEDQILGMLIREANAMSSDYLTEVEVTPKPTVNPMSYNYYDRLTRVITTVVPSNLVTTKSTIPFWKLWYFWLLVLMVNCFVVCYVFKQMNR